MTTLLPPLAPEDRPRLLQEAGQLAASLPGMKLATRRVAERGGFGLHGRKRGGIGFDFFETRLWRTGDSPRAIDHKSSARHPQGELLVRVLEWEMPQTVWLWCDRSPSMRWRSRNSLPGKEEYALVLALAIAKLLGREREAIGLLDGSSRPATGLVAQARLAACLLDRALHTTFPAPPPGSARHALAILIGDFLSPLDEWREALSHLCQAGLSGCLIRVLDPAEADPAPIWQGSLLLEGTEGETPLTLGNGNSALSAYRDAFAAHANGLDDMARRLSWPLLTHTTDQDPRTLLLALAGVLGHPPAGLAQTG